MTDVFLDLNQVRRYRKSFEPETPLDLIFPRESSAVKISVNVITTTVMAACWARGWQRFKGLNRGFASSYTRNAALFSVIYFPSNELMSILLPKYFNIDNLFANNLSSSLFTFAAVSLFQNMFFSQNKLTMAKHALHLFTYSLYFDISIALLRDKLLDRKNPIFQQEHLTPEQKIEQFKLIQKDSMLASK